MLQVTTQNYVLQGGQVGDSPPPSASESLVSLALTKINNPKSKQKNSFRSTVRSFAPAETLSPFPEIYETIKKSALASPQNAELMFR